MLPVLLSQLVEADAASSLEGTLLGFARNNASTADAEIRKFVHRAEAQDPGILDELGAIKKRFYRKRNLNEEEKTLLHVLEDLIPQGDEEEQGHSEVQGRQSLHDLPKEDLHKLLDRIAHEIDRYSQGLLEVLESYAPKVGMEANTLALELFSDSVKVSAARVGQAVRPHAGALYHLLRLIQASGGTYG